MVKVGANFTSSMGLSISSCVGQGRRTGAVDNFECCCLLTFFFIVVACVCCDVFSPLFFGWVGDNSERCSRRCCVGMCVLHRQALDDFKNQSSLVGADRGVSAVCVFSSALGL